MKIPIIDPINTVIQFIIVAIMNIKL